jgi:hypothetical protein
MSKTATQASEQNSANSDDSQEDDVKTLEDLRLEFDHPIVRHAKAPVSKQMSIEPVAGTITEHGTWSEPYYDDVETTSYTCNSCVMEFDTRDEAVSHLKKQLARYRSKWILPGIPYESHTDTTADGWTDETTEVLCGVIQESHSHAYGRVVEGLDQYIAHARKTYSIPPDYNWSDWEAYEDGGLTFPDGTEMFRSSILTKAVQEISQNYEHPYMAEAFTFHLLPEGLGLMHAFGEAIVIAPVIYSPDTEDN